MWVLLLKPNLISDSQHTISSSKFIIWEFYSAVTRTTRFCFTSDLMRKWFYSSLWDTQHSLDNSIPCSNIYHILRTNTISKFLSGLLAVPHGSPQVLKLRKYYFLFTKKEVLFPFYRWNTEAHKLWKKSIRKCRHWVWSFYVSLSNL